MTGERDGRTNDAPIIYRSLSKAVSRAGMAAGWEAVGTTPRLDGALAAIASLGRALR